MTHPIAIYIVFTALLLFFSAFFSASEAALFSLGRLELDRIREVKSRIANLITGLLEKPRELITTIFLANEVVNSAIAILVASVFYSILGDSNRDIASIMSIAFTTTILLFFGEIIPKATALRNSDTFSVICVGPVHLFSRFVSPLRIILTKIADGIVAIFGSVPQTAAGIIKEEEFRLLVRTGGKEGTLEPVEEELIQNVFDFGDKTVSEIMTPREKIFFLSYDLGLEGGLAKIREKRFGRIPVYKGVQDNVVGILYIKDLLRRDILKGEGLRKSLGDVLRKPYFVPPRKKLDELFREFQASKVHMALVVSEFGTIIGLVTMEDLLDEIFGEP